MMRLYHQVNRSILNGLQNCKILNNRFCHGISNGQLTYVQRMKMLQNLKEKAGLEEGMMKNGKYLVYYGSKPLLTDKFTIAWMDYSQLDMDIKIFKESTLLLGLSDDSQLQFAVQLKNLDKGKQIRDDVEGRSEGYFADFRLGLLMMPTTDASAASKANAIFNWHRKNKFCASCGSVSVRSPSGLCRNCQNCGQVWYPNLSPVGIVVVTDTSRSRLLLVRQSRHPKGMYSCIAGYVDSGETIEESIRREVAEEVGLTVQSVCYKSSQHWSFPTSNLMIGCHATVSGDETLDIDRAELDDARWFSIEEVKRSLSAVENNPLQVMASAKEGDFFVPPRGAIAHTLIKSWIKEWS